MTWWNVFFICLFDSVVPTRFCLSRLYAVHPRSPSQATLMILSHGQEQEKPIQQIKPKTPHSNMLGNILKQTMGEEILERIIITRSG